MIIKDREVILKNGQNALIRSARIEDSFEMVEVRKMFYEESPYLLLEEEEFHTTAIQQSKFIENLLNDPDEMILVAIIDDHIVAILTLSHILNVNKAKHRAELGISVLKDYWHLGIAKMMIEVMKQNLTDSSFKQIELGVCTNNAHAIRLYQNAGFITYGILPNAFKVNDEYISELLMYLKWSSR